MGRLRELAELHVKLDRIEAKISAIYKIVNSQSTPFQCVYLTSGSQTTINALKMFTEPVAANQISAVTDRKRAMESAHLNELYRQGVIDKSKVGRTKLFLLKDKYR
jgi:hypothetical protein